MGRFPPAKVPISPTLLVAAWHRGKRVRQPIRFWFLFRAEDVQGSGRIAWRQAMGIIMESGLSKRTAYRILHDGENAGLWHTEHTYPHGHGVGVRPRRTLRLTGARALVVAWGIENIRPLLVDVPRPLWLGAPLGRLVYHISLPGEPPLRRRKDGAVGQPKLDHPYSRQSIANDTGISRATQIRGDKLTWEARKIAPIRAHSVFDRTRYLGKCREWWVDHRRLGNSYSSKLPRRGWGMGKAIKKELGKGDRPQAANANGSSSTGGRPRRFFETTRSYRVVSRRQPIAADPMLRLLPGSEGAPVCVRKQPWIGWWDPISNTGPVDLRGGVCHS